MVAIGTAKEVTLCRHLAVQKDAIAPIQEPCINKTKIICLSTLSGRTFWSKPVIFTTGQTTVHTLCIYLGRTWPQWSWNALIMYCSQQCTSHIASEIGMLQKQDRPKTTAGKLRCLLLRSSWLRTNSKDQYLTSPHFIHQDWMVCMQHYSSGGLDALLVGIFGDSLALKYIPKAREGVKCIFPKPTLLS